MRHLRSHHLAVNLYRRTATVRLPSHLKDQWLRASSSIALNLAEGCGKPTLADQARFFSIAMGSIRECQAIAQLQFSAFNTADHDLLDHLAREVHPLLSIDGAPEFVSIYRHKQGIPQYLLHHGDCLAAIQAAEDRYPGLALAGNAYRGVGLNDCVVSAHRAVERLTQ